MEDKSQPHVGMTVDWADEVPYSPGRRINYWLLKIKKRHGEGPFKVASIGKLFNGEPVVSLLKDGNLVVSGYGGVYSADKFNWIYLQPL